MALNPAQQNKIMQLLGYGGKAIQAGSVIYDKIMNDRLHNLPPPLEAVTVDYLSQIDNIETQIKTVPNRLQATEIQDIKINLQELEMLRRERKKLAREMAQHLDIPYQGMGGANLSVRN